MALNAAERGAGLTRSLLAFSRKQMLAPRVCNLNKLVSSTTNMLSRTLGETIRIETELAPDLAPVRIDPNQFQSLVLNLAINARHAMPEGGTLSIRTRNVAITRQVDDMRPGHYALFSVADDGTGMTPEALEHAFEPFFTTKRGTGSGLGLSMIYGFVKQSGGHIRIDSARGVGTTVDVHLPHADETESDDMGRRRGSSSSPIRPNRLVLLVEDEPEVRQVVLAQLRSLSYRVIEAEDAHSALEEHTKARRVDVLLTDVVMPGGMSGYDLADEIRKRQPDIDVLFMSGYDDAAARSSELRGTLIQKPFRMLDLKVALNALLEGKSVSTR